MTSPKNLLDAYNVSDILSSPVLVLSCLIFTVTLWDSDIISFYRWEIGDWRDLITLYSQ